MSLATEYADRQAQAKTDQASVTAGVPPPFVGPNGMAHVTPEGNLRLTQTTSGDFEIPPMAALAFAAWINRTFG